MNQFGLLNGKKLGKVGKTCFPRNGVVSHRLQNATPKQCVEFENQIDSPSSTKKRDRKKIVTFSSDFSNSGIVKT